jgi:hypothetical protein
MMKQAQDNANSAAKNTVEFAKTQSEPIKSSGGMRVEPPFNNFNVEAPMPTGQVITGYGGKPAPAPAPQPEL